MTPLKFSLLKLYLLVVGVLAIGGGSLIALLQSKAKPKEPMIWLGCPVVGSPFGQAGVFTNAEYGLREDGVLVWRKR